MADKKPNETYVQVCLLTEVVNILKEKAKEENRSLRSYLRVLLTNYAYNSTEINLIEKTNSNNLALNNLITKHNSTDTNYNYTEETVDSEELFRIPKPRIKTNLNKR